MHALEVLLHQDPEVLIPCAAIALAILNQALKMIMATIRIGIIVSLMTALGVYIPHIY